MATGAAIVPPVPPCTRSNTTATAKRSLKPMNHGSLRPCRLTSAVPVLPATSTPSSAAAVPVPSLTTLRIMSPTFFAESSDITRSASSGSGSSTVRPSGSTILETSRGSIRTPPLPIVCATVAICSGVTSRSPWPIATRPMSTASEVGFTSRLRPLLTPLATICESG